MGLLRDLIERKHQDARDEMFRQYDTNKSILMDPRGVEAGGFSDEQKQAALHNIVSMASPTKQHAQAVLPVFGHLLGLAGMAAGRGGGAGGGARGTVVNYGGGGNVGREAMGPPEAPGPTPTPTQAQAPVSPAQLAVDATGAPMQMDDAGPVTTGSVRGDTGTGTGTGVAAKPDVNALATPAPGPMQSRSDPSSVYGVPGVSAQVGPPGTSVSPRMLIDGNSPEEEDMATQPPFPGQSQSQPQQPTGDTGRADVGSTRPSLPSTQTAPVPQGQGQGQGQGQPQGNRPVILKGTGVNAFPTFEERMDRARQIAEFNVRLKGEGMLQLQPYEQQAAKQQLEFQLQQMGQMVKGGMDPQVAAVRAGLKAMPGAYYTSQTRPVPGSAYVEGIDPDTGEKVTGFNNAAGKFTPTRGVKLKTTNPGKETPADQTYKNQLAAYADKLKKRVEDLTPQEKLDAVQKDTGALALIERAKATIAHPEMHTPEEVESAKFYLKGQEQNQQRVAVTIQGEQGKLADIEAAKQIGNIPARSPGIDPNSRDENVLANLTPVQRQQIKMLANYDMTVTPYMLGKAQNPYWANMMALAQVYDPTFSPAQYEVRQSIKKQYTTGKPAANIVSLNTVIGHMGTLAEMAVRLQNNQAQFANELKNYVRDKMGKSEVNNFNMAATAVIDELAATFKASGVTDQAVNQWKDRIKQAQSPHQLADAIRTGEELLVSRVAGLSGAWHNPSAMGDAPFQFLNPHSIQVLHQLGLNADRLGLMPQDLPRQGQGQAAPAPGQSPGQAPGQSPDITGQTQGGYLYTAAPTDISPTVMQGLQDGKAHSYKSNSGENMVIKLVGGRVYKVQKAAGGK